MDYQIIQTGSSGNAVVINGHILIDCGVSMKKLRPYIRDLNLVLLTHIHGDHFKESTVRELHRQRPILRFGCCKWMLDPLLNAGVDKRSIDVYEFLGTEGLTYTYLVRSPFCVRPVKLTHNVPNCGYVISESSETAFYATDTGTLEGISEKDCELYLIEANHGEAELEARAAAKLEAGEYSYESAAAVNHLSKEKALDWLSQNMGPQSKYVFLHRHENREEVNNGGREDAEGIHQDF